jgi:hypothetical protein
MEYPFDGWLRDISLVDKLGEWQGCGLISTDLACDGSSARLSSQSSL